MKKLCGMIIIGFLLFVSCSSSPEGVTGEVTSLLDIALNRDKEAVTFSDNWESVYPGIEQNIILRPELPIAVYAFRIDLHHPERQVFVGSLEPVEGYHSLSKKVSTFAEEQNLLLAINGTTFSPYREDEGLGVNLRTLSIHKGEIQAPQRDSMAALMVMKDGTVNLHWPPFDYENIEYAVGGGPLFLLEGKNRGRSDQRHPRSSIGLSQDGRYLILMVIDGRDSDYSIGATLSEAATWMRDLGAWTAMNLDGGGSSSLVWKNPDSGDWEVVNRPSGPPGRGEERAVANHIGIR